MDMFNLINSLPLAFALEGTGATSSTFSITNELITPIQSAITDGLGVLLPVGIGIMCTFLGIRLIKRIIYTFF